MFDNVTDEQWEQLLNGKTVEIPVGTVKATPVHMDGRVYDDSGQENVSVVFEVDGRFYLKSGYFNSWDNYDCGAFTWDSKVKEVTKKTIEVYE